MKETVYIYHTNDLHSHFENWAQIERFLSERRKQHAAANETMFVFDVGDHVDRSHPFTEGTEGRGNITFLNAVQTDAVTIGNNEGITMPKEQLERLYEEANFSVVVSNFLEKTGECPKWVKPYQLFTTLHGSTLAIIGATACYDTFYEQLGWQVTEPITALRKVLDELPPEVDYIICLSHLGIPLDEQVVTVCPEIDLVLGAHTHHLFPEGEWRGNTLMAATGKFGQYIGEVQVVLGTPLEQRATVYATAQLPATSEETKRVQQKLQQGQCPLQERLFYNPRHLPPNLFRRSPLSSFFGRALVAYTGAECALFNAGIFLGHLSKGWVTYADLHRLLPHPINACVVELTGHELQTIYKASFNEEWTKLEFQGLGFRGGVFGKMMHERLFKNRYGELFVGNRQVANDHIYRVAVLDMFTFGYFFPTLKDVPKTYLLPDFLRDIVAQYGKLTYGDYSK